MEKQLAVGKERNNLRKKRKKEKGRKLREEQGRSLFRF
jgi:hypothetical protein